MDHKLHLYINRKSPFFWLMVLCLSYSVAARIVVYGFTRYGLTVGFWGQLVLPAAATVLYLWIVLTDGAECFYKTSVPVCMMAGYCAICVAKSVEGRLYVWLFWIALIFLCFLYAEIVSGNRGTWVWFLPFLMASALSVVLYNNKQVLLSMDRDGFIRIHMDLLVLVGCLLGSFAVRIHPAGQYHRHWGDRSDGCRIRSLGAMDQVSPYIMVNRNTATNYFTDAFEISGVDRYIRQKRREGLTNFGIMHVFLAAYCRTMAVYPGLNRFISGQKVYSRGEDIQFCLTIKKEMSTRSPETIVKVHLSPRDTVFDVYRKLNTQVEKAKQTPLDSGFDNTAHALMLVPGVCLKFLVWFLKTLDYFGMLPKFLLEISPFHGSIFFTSMGSLGIPPIYHHLYDFGNLPVFGSFGCKRKAVEVLEDGTILQRKYVDFKFTLDERIVDGYYYAAFFKHFKRVIAKPEMLDNPPETVKADID